MDSLLIKKIKTAGGHYVYDTWTNEILAVDAAVYRLLPDGPGSTPAQEATGNGEGRKALGEILEARRSGYFRERSPTVSSFSESAIDDSLRNLVVKGPDHLILNTTERCNLRCRYCSFSGAYEGNRVHSERVMEEPVLKAALDWYLAHRRDEYSIGFYGGEPLFDFPLMEKAVRYAGERRGKRVTYRLTTNGTLLRETTCRFLVDNDFRLMVSLDGPRPVHDRFRVTPGGKGSFEALWNGLMRLRSMAPDYFARRVAYNVVAASPVELVKIHEFMEEHPQFFHDHMITVSRVNPYPSCLPEEPADQGRDGNLAAQREALFETFRDKLLSGAAGPENFPFALFKSDFADMHQRVMSTMRDVIPSNGQCVPGDPKCFVSTDGILHMCERVGDSMPIGTVWKGLDTRVIGDFLRDYDRFFAEACTRCWAVRLCHKCFVTMRHGNVFSRERMEEFCRSNLRRWGWVLEKYCEIREMKADAFSWCEGPG